jgi:hypothetical protein
MTLVDYFAAVGVIAAAAVSFAVVAVAARLPLVAGSAQKTTCVAAATAKTPGRCSTAQQWSAMNQK